MKEESSIKNHPLVKEAKGLHAKMQEVLKVENGDCYFTVMQFGGETLTAYHGTSGDMANALLQAVANQKDLSINIMEAIKEAPGFTEMVLSMALDADTSQLSTDNEAKCSIANALRDLANKIEGK